MQPESDFASEIAPKRPLTSRPLFWVAVVALAPILVLRVSVIATLAFDGLAIAVITLFDRLFGAGLQSGCGVGLA